MDSTKKQKKTTIDFNVSLRSKSKENIIKKDKTPFSLSSNMQKTFGSVKGFSKFFVIMFKRFKRSLYKKFFWGRGLYYRFSVLIAIIFLIIPVTVLASNIKTIDDQKVINPRIIDTAYDTGNGKTSIPNNKTVEAVQNYTVQKGDTISTIAAKFDISTDTLKYSNNLSSDYLQIGQSLKILPISGILYKVKAGDTLDSIAKKYNIAKSGYSPQVMLEINLLDSTTLIANQEILVPGAVIEQPVNSKPSTPSAPQKILYAQITGSKFISPTGGLGNITTCFSSIHPAVDIDSLQGNIPLYASAAGTVVYAGWGLSGGSGIAVSIDHGNGYVTQYLHLSRLMVSVGDNLKQGQQIGLMGATGRATGIHIHFIIKYNGHELNPFEYVDLSKYPREYTATSC